MCVPGWKHTMQGEGIAGTLKGKGVQNRLVCARVQSASTLVDVFPQPTISWECCYVKTL